MKQWHGWLFSVLMLGTAWTTQHTIRQYRSAIQQETQAYGTWWNEMYAALRDIDSVLPGSPAVSHLSPSEALTQADGWILRAAATEQAQVKMQSPEAPTDKQLADLAMEYHQAIQTLLGDTKLSSQRAAQFLQQSLDGMLMQLPGEMFHASDLSDWNTLLKQDLSYLPQSLQGLRQNSGK